MTFVDRFPGQRHPLCTCPDWTPDFAGAPEPGRSARAGGATAHPVLSREDLDHLAKEFRRDRE